VREPVQTDGVAFPDDPAQQVRVALGLVRQAEPSGLGAQVRTELQGLLGGQGQPALEAVQGLGLVVGRAAELEPVLPVQGEGQPANAQVKFRSERLMNSREKSSSSVWNCLSCPWKKL
jgi:hypothetical protein